MSNIHQILHRYWGFDSFRPQQEQIIQAVLQKKDTLALLPTGGGKSVCYQVPALANEGICLVISPLIALMKDQVENLKAKGIGALLIYSGMSHRDIIRTLENARSSYFKFLYVSPERLETSLFREYLPAFHVNLIAVDEAHCISQWGYDFRPSYLKIAALREELPDVPVLAVTASATQDVQDDICEKLQMRSPQVFRQSFERSNLSYSVFNAESKINQLLKVVTNVSGSGIIYCKSRKRTSEIASLLKMHGIAADNYHAGLPTGERNKRQQEWLDNRVQVIVCTNAFGMGIDKPDVRYVVHADLPDCLENYYQEAGRCGRDGQKAFAVLLYDHTDMEDLRNLHLTRYPSLQEIKHIYTAMVNFLQIPANSGQDQRYLFRFEEFIRNYKLNASTALYALKALEQDGWLQFNERNFLPSTVVFTTNKDNLYEFYRNHPHLEHLAVTLLRTYDGIFDFPSFISENTLSNLLKVTPEEIIKNLQRLSAFHIIEYTPQTDEPHIIFRKNRVQISDFSMNLYTYEQRKKTFLKRVAHMIQYVQHDSCRSAFIGKYFGDEAMKHCGVCDNCLMQKRMALSAEEFSTIADAIKKNLQHQTCTTDELIVLLRPISNHKTRKVIEFMQAENQIRSDLSGRLSCN